METEKITENKVMCLNCKGIVESKDDSIETCSCGRVKISGGFMSLKRFELTEGVDYTELSQFYLVEAKQSI